MRKNVIATPLIFFFSTFLLSCEQIYPLQIGSGFKIGYNAHSILTLLDSNNAILSECLVGGYYKDESLIVIRCANEFTFERKNGRLSGHAKYSIHRIGETLTSEPMDSTVVWQMLKNSGRENIRIIPLPHS